MILNDKYYIHKNTNNTYSIWTVDDMYKMTGDISTKEQAKKILAIMPHSIVMEDKINDNKARTR